MGGGHEFRDECGESLNLAINSVADVLHTLYNRAHHERRGYLSGYSFIDLVRATHGVTEGWKPVVRLFGVYFNPATV